MTWCCYRWAYTLQVQVEEKGMHLHIHSHTQNNDPTTPSLYTISHPFLTHPSLPGASNQEVRSQCLPVLLRAAPALPRLSHPAASAGGHGQAMRCRLRAQGVCGGQCG